MDRVHRHELKHDAFVQQVGHTVEYAAAHRQQLAKWLIVGLGVVLIAAGIYWYTRHLAAQRQDALREAIRAQEANVGANQSPFLLSYPTEADKRKAVDKAWSDLVGRFPDSEEAVIAHHYMGVNAADRGDIKAAENHFKQAADAGKAAYASQAKLSLAQIYESTGRNAEAEKLLRSLVDSPTIMVSKEQALIALARVMAKSKPAEARKLLEPLRSERSIVSRAVITALSEMPAR